VLEVFWQIFKAVVLFFLIIIIFEILLFSGVWGAFIVSFIMDPLGTLSQIFGTSDALNNVLTGIFLLFMVVVLSFMLLGFIVQIREAGGFGEWVRGGLIRVYGQRGQGERVEKDRTNEGRHVELIHTSNPRTSLKPGDRGRYEWVYKYPSSLGNHHYIRWERGSNLVLVDGKDRFKFVDEEKLDEEKGEE